MVTGSNCLREVVQSSWTRLFGAAVHPLGETNCPTKSTITAAGF
jgi:hypothetical protein